MLIKNSLLLFFSFFVFANSLYEDQVGKFDWRAQFLGSPHEVFFKRIKGRDILLVSSEMNVLSSLDIANGNIVWRQMQDTINQTSPIFVYNVARDTVIVYSHNYVRAFDYSTGIVKWETFINLSTYQKTGILNIIKNVVIFSSGSTIYAIKISNGAILWTYDFKDKSEWIDVAENGDNGINLIGGVPNQKIGVIKMSLDNGSLQNRLSFDVLLNFEKCVTKGKHVVCFDHEAVYAVDFSSDSLKTLKLMIEQPLHVYSTPENEYFVVKTVSSLQVLHVGNGEVRSMLKVESSDVFSTSIDFSSNDPLFMVYYDALRTVKAFNLRTSKNIVTSELVPDRQASVKKLAFLSSEQTIELITIRKDGRMDLYETRFGSKEAVIEWTRFDGLAVISSVEMIDLPLSEAQATIETEFTDKDGGILKTFILRLTSQVELFKRLFIQFAHRLVKSFELITTNQASISNTFRYLLGDEILKSSKPLRSGTLAKQDSLVMERDYFNLRKMIIVSTLSGSVYGIHNEDGSVVWSLYLGDDFDPLHDQLGNVNVPLFIQRSTSHFQYPSEAIVAFNIKQAKSSRLVAFNPITGDLVNTYQIERIKRINLLPFTNDEHIHPVMVLDVNSKIDFFPSYSVPLPYPIFQFNFDASSGVLYGEKIDAATRKISSTWKNQLRLGKSEKIVAVANKPFSQKLHSQGKVLGDRNVLYKYSNPNLIAIASFDETESMLTIYMVDAINGNIVYTGRHPRTRPPFHLVHCENWLAYSYWNEKARRTEIGVIELYEGLTPSNAVHFNSLTSEKHPLTIYAQSFIFSQGISAMTATETEQGLTNRNLLIALPFGGLLEVSKRFVDARRTIEMTPELREEMIIPYMPELLIATEDLINYNQSIFNIQGIKTFPSGLESTSLVLAYGMDLFYTRVSPSGTFDILKDDFDFAFLTIVMVVLIVGSFVVKRIWRNNSIEQAWS